MSAPSFRLEPNLLECGDLATVKIEWAPPEAAGERITVELVETDEQGEGGVVMARFAATLAGAAGTWGFDEVERESLPIDVEGDMELPPEDVLETSRDGAITVPGTETSWQRGHLKVQLPGSADEHVVILRVAEGRDATKRECGVFELKLVVRDAAGATLYDSGSQVAFVDCWKALTANCVAAVRNQLEVHHYLCDQRTSGGDYYGSQSSGSMKAGKKVTDCVTYAIQVLERAYAELRSTADYRYLHTKKGDYKRYHVGSLFTPALHELGWSILLFGADVEDLKERRYQDYTAGKFWIAHTKGTLFGRPCEVVGDYKPMTDWDTGAARPPNAEALARYDALKDVPFGIIALSLGSHVVMKVGAEIYECHWSEKSDAKNLFDRESKSWESLKDDDVFMLACPTYALRELEEGQSGGEGDGGEGAGGSE